MARGWLQKATQEHQDPGSIFFPLFQPQQSSLVFDKLLLQFTRWLPRLQTLLANNKVQSNESMFTIICPFLKKDSFAREFPPEFLLILTGSVAFPTPSHLLARKMGLKCLTKKHRDFYQSHVGEK